MPFEKGKSGNPETQFSSEYQPEKNGRKGKSVSEWLSEYGEAKELDFNITVTKSNGEKKIQKGKVESETTINQLLAVTIINKAIQGDNKALTTFLDRTEGRPKQSIDLSNKGDKFKELSLDELKQELAEILSEDEGRDI